MVKKGKPEIGSLKVTVMTRQEYGKPCLERTTFTFCCWQGLKNWLNRHEQVYNCPCGYHELLTEVTD
jgi:hypothetical protein